ncbi:MAG: division/cell wall cluster transcriptional repressor MraZ [Erysipelotrichaceae bacterium]|nr:division/cell wall cluster transcriptional repressor MraZ [Erysipelotrichaceae bacterium]
MFMGQYSHNVDLKGRIIIPAKFREELGNVIVVTRGLDGCLSVYTQKQWQTIYEQLIKLPSTKKESRMYVRTFMANAAECEFDQQGRILLPPALIQAALITKECIVIGSGDHIEIWSKQRWFEFAEVADESLEAIAESLTEFVR